MPETTATPDPAAQEATHDNPDHELWNCRCALVSTAPVPRFYVTMTRDTRVAWLLGPYTTHEEALALVPAARALASAADPWTDFDPIGTACLTSVNHPIGKLNNYLEKTLDIMQKVD